MGERTSTSAPERGAPPPPHTPPAGAGGPPGTSQAALSVPDCPELKAPAGALQRSLRPAPCPDVGRCTPVRVKRCSDNHWTTVRPPTTAPSQCPARPPTPPLALPRAQTTHPCLAPPLPPTPAAPPTMVNSRFKTLRIHTAVGGEVQGRGGGGALGAPASGGCARRDLPTPVAAHVWIRAQPTHSRGTSHKPGHRSVPLHCCVSLNQSQFWATPKSSVSAGCEVGVGGVGVGVGGSNAVFSGTKTKRICRYGGSGVQGLVPEQASAHDCVCTPKTRARREGWSGALTGPCTVGHRRRNGLGVGALQQGAAEVRRVARSSPGWEARAVGATACCKRDPHPHPLHPARCAPPTCRTGSRARAARGARGGWS